MYLRKTLNTILDGNSHTIKFAADYGSNGARDFYRNIAKCALEDIDSLENEVETTNGKT